MKRVLYLTNIESPYRVRFFNQLARQCDLTVLFERRHCAVRRDHLSGESDCRFRKRYLRGIPLRRESAFSLGILKEVSRDYDCIIVGCYNSPAQMAAILWMQLRKIPYFLSTDGELFLQGNSLKTRLKRYFLRGAAGYLAAGPRSTEALAEIAGEAPVIPYYFSSLTQAELAQCRSQTQARENTVLVVGRDLACKGMDVALEAARLDPETPYRFVGMGNDTERFRRKHAIPPNVRLIPFLSKNALAEEYQRCGMLLLPSRQECWGLVVNEAAAYGTPIVSTRGSGAALEFLADRYPQYLATPGDAQDLHRAILALRHSRDLDYPDYLRRISAAYSIEAGVAAHMSLIRKGEETK